MQQQEIQREDTKGDSSGAEKGVELASWWSIDKIIRLSWTRQLETIPDEGLSFKLFKTPPCHYTTGRSAERPAVTNDKKLEANNKRSYKTYGD